MRRFEAQRGLSMVEVLVTLLVLSVGVLGFAGLQMRALNATNDSYYRGQAMVIAQDLRERYRMNSTTPQGGSTSPTSYYTGASWTATPSLHTCENGTMTACSDTTGQKIANYDVNMAISLAQTMLPQGQVAMISCPGASGTVCIVVSWAGTAPATDTTGLCLTSSGTYNMSGGVSGGVTIPAGTPPNCLVLEANGP